jgi:hypothetical protein
MKFLQATYYTDEYINNSYKIVDINDFNSQSSVRNFALGYLTDINKLQNILDITSSRQVTIDGANLDITYLYVPFSYKPGVDCLNIDSSLTTDKINLTRSFVKSGIITSFPYATESAGSGSNGSGGFLKSLYSYAIYISDGILVEKSYINIGNRLSDYYRISADEFASTEFIKQNASFANYRKCKILTYTLKPITGNYPAKIECLILASLQTFDYLEDFSADVFYSSVNQDYYADAAFTKELNLRAKYDYFPYLILNESSILHGPVSQKLDITTDATLETVSDLINAESYVSICDFASEQSDPPPAGSGTIFCSLSDVGRAIVNYGGKAYYFLDTQICGSTPKTVMAIFSLKDYENLKIYKDFTVLNSVLVDIYAYNFRYIKYKKGDTFYNFLDNGSVASTTIKYSGQALDFAKYFSLKEQNDGNNNITISAISFNFLIYKSATSDTDATQYILDVPITALSPRYLGAEEKSATKLIIKTSYATRISYYFGDDPTTAVSVNITNDTADGSNQETEIDISGITGDVHIDLFNYLYDVDSGERDLYSSKGNSYKIERDLIVPTFNFSIKQGGTTASFYEESNPASSINQINITDANQSSFNNYILYSDYTNTGDFEFILTFTLPSTSTFVALYLGDSSFPLSAKVQSGVGSVITKLNLFKLAKSDGSIDITFSLDGRIQYVLPFKFKNYSSNSPACDPIAAPEVTLKNTEASAEFSFSYRYSDIILYSILDNNSNVLYGPIQIIEPYSASLVSYFTSGTTKSRSIKISNFPVLDSSISMKVRVVVKNINSSRDEVEVTVDSSTFAAIPQKLSRTTPAKILFFSDQAMTTPVETINKNVLYYAFFQLYDVDDVAINTANYGNYISINPAPKFVMVESTDGNIDLQGVTLTRINDYLYSFKIPVDSPFNDEAFVLDVLYLPIIDLEQK